MLWPSRPVLRFIPADFCNKSRGLGRFLLHSAFAGRGRLQGDGCWPVGKNDIGNQIDKRALRQSAPVTGHLMTDREMACRGWPGPWRPILRRRNLVAIFASRFDASRRSHNSPLNALSRIAGSKASQFNGGLSLQGPDGSERSKYAKGSHLV